MQVEGLKGFTEYRKRDWYSREMGSSLHQRGDHSDRLVLYVCQTHCCVYILTVTIPYLH